MYSLTELYSMAHARMVLESREDAKFESRGCLYSTAPGSTTTKLSRPGKQFHVFYFLPDVRRDNQDFETTWLS